MTSKNRLIKNLKIHFQLVETILQQKHQDFKPESIHELRIEFKKVNLILSIVKSSGYRLKKQKQINHLMQLFKQAGKIRELQLVILQLNFWKEKYSISKPISILKAELKMAKLAFIELNKISIKYKNIEHSIISSLEKYKQLHTFLPKMKSKINDAFEKMNTMLLNKIEQQNRKKIELHKLRINIKKMVNYLKFSTEDIVNKQLDDLEMLNNQLGEWHDFVVLKSYALRFIKNNARTKSQFVDATLIIWENQKKIDGLERWLFAKILSMKKV